MLQLSAALLNRPVLSLRTSGVVATTLSPIINPNNLKIEGFYCADTFSKNNLILLTQDIRDILTEGIAVNDHDVLTEPDELIRLKDILDIGFVIDGKLVQTEAKRKIGKVADYAADSQTLYIQKLYVSQSMLKNMGSSQLSIDRNQIVEITDRRIVIKEFEKPSKANTVVAPAAA